MALICAADARFDAGRRGHLAAALATEVRGGRTPGLVVVVVLVDRRHPEQHRGDEREAGRQHPEHHLPGQSHPRPVQVAGLANHAGPDSAGAFPSVATPVRYTGLAEGTSGSLSPAGTPRRGSELVARGAEHVGSPLWLPWPLRAGVRPPGSIEINDGSLAARAWWADRPRHGAGSTLSTYASRCSGFPLRFIVASTAGAVFHHKWAARREVTHR